MYCNTRVLFQLRWPCVGCEEKEAALPDYFVMSTEAKHGSKHIMDGNAGIMLLNLDGLRKTYDDFINYTFSEQCIRAGLLFPCHMHGIHPLDQGAYKFFYKNRTQSMPAAFWNWRPWWPTSTRERGLVKLLHFHGPKYHEYVAHRNGKPVNPLFLYLFKDCSKVGCYEWIDQYLSAIDLVKCVDEHRCSIPKYSQVV